MMGEARLGVQDFEPPSGDLAKAIEADFGSVVNLISKFNPKAAAVQVMCTLFGSRRHMPMGSPKAAHPSRPRTAGLSGFQGSDSWPCFSRGHRTPVRG